ncbi:MAG: hypothetical protein NTW65_07175 [Deltaproteobacteria bacterium]|nr:hypothetical protein [Deltaproteobacteria bacterium]
MDQKLLYLSNPGLWNCKKSLVLGLFKNVQVQGAQKTELRGVYGYTLSGAVCSATQQMSVFQQSLCLHKIPGN